MRAQFGRVATMVEPKPLSDPRVLRAIAHPVRTRILDEMSATGPVRAADIAQALGIPANQASFHLRQLAKYGLVTEAPEEARDKRDRVWKLAAEDGISFRSQDMLAQPGGTAAMEVYKHNARSWGHLLVDRSLATEPDGAPEKYTNQGSLRFTQEEVAEFAEDFRQLQNRWREKTRGHDDGRITYSVYQLVQPYPDMEQVENAED